MEYKINSDFKFGDKIFVCQIVHEDEDGKLIIDPFIREELVENIILRFDGFVSYHTEPHFRTFEEAKKFCEESLYDDGLHCCDIEDCIFQWEECKKGKEVQCGQEVEYRTWHLDCMTEQLFK